MTDKIFITREEPVRRLSRVILAIIDAVNKSDTPDGRRIVALNVALEANCVGCHARINGAELLVLAQSPSGQIEPRLARLRRGRCANETCRQEIYRLVLRKHADLDWNQLLSQPARLHEQQGPEELEEETQSDVVRPKARPYKYLRIGLLAAGVLLALLFRQWYRGGQIPLIRQPEHFRVAPSPPGVAETNLDAVETSSALRRIPNRKTVKE